MHAAEFDHGARAFDAQLGLLRSWLVINAGVNDTAVVGTLMLAHTIFLFQQQQAKTGKALRDFEGDGEADDASADDDHVAA